MIAPITRSRKPVLTKREATLLASTAITLVVLASCVEWMTPDSTNAPAPFAAQILYTSNIEDGEKIYILNTASSSRVRLTDNMHNIWRPLWSPDGKQIAFYSDQDGDWDLYVMDGNGESATNLTHNEVDDRGRFSWSPDSSRLVFDGKYSDPSKEIYVVNIEEGILRPITHDRIWQGNPAWLPDGKRIIYSTAEQAEVYGLAITGIETGDTVQLLENERWASLPDISSDGNWIAFEAVREDGFSRIDVIKADGSIRYESICGDNLAHSPIWSPDGEWIAFVGGPKDNDLSQLFITRRDGSEITTLVEDGVVNFPSWSPDGKWIAFTGESGRIDRRLGDLDIYAVNVETKEVYNLTASKGDDRDPDWRPQP
jgi:TolB protein